MFQAVERGHGIINKSTGELHGREVLRRANMSPRSRSHTTCYAATWVGWEVTIDVTVHDKRSNLRHKGADDGPLKQE